MKVDKDTAKKLMGRGEVKISKMKPKIKTKVERDKSIRNCEMYKAIEYLKQGRRCEQINHRIERGKEANEGKKAKYSNLNKEAAELIIKHLDLKDEKDKDFKAKIQKIRGPKNKHNDEAMMGPTVKLQMQRYYGLYEKWKRKAVEKEEKEAQKLYASKGRGQ